MTREPEPFSRAFSSEPAPNLLQRRVYGTLGLSLLVGLYLLVGLLGHDPWRGDDARHLGPVLSMLNGEGWLIPRLAGEAWLEYPPLHYWLASLGASLSSAVLPLHAGARLASAFTVALAVFLTARSAEILYGRPARTPAALLLLGALGLVLHAHETQPLLSLLAALAMSLYGFAQLPARPLAGSLTAGCASTLAFLSAGLSGLLLTAPLFVLLMLISPDCRNPRASGALLLGLSLALALACIWPLTLHLQAPELFQQWLQLEWARLSSGFATSAQLQRGLELFGWFTWPLWPLALWTVWRARRRLADLRWLLPVLSILLVLAQWAFTDTRAQADALPLLPALGLLAAAGVHSLRRGAANAFSWFSLLGLAVFGILVWLAWSAQALGWPSGLARHVARNAPDFILPSPSLQALLGGAISLAWIALLWRLPRSHSRAPANWTIGLTMLWCLAVVLLMPWFDNARSYRAVAQSLSLAIEGERDADSQLCVAGLELPAHLRASLDYFAALRTRMVNQDGSPCGLLLLRKDSFSNAGLLPHWQPVWEYKRGAGRHSEHFVLLRREAAD